MEEMPIIPCIQCNLNEGHIFLCGEGLMCSECMAQLTDEPEELFFDDASVTDEVRDKARQRLHEEH